MLLDGLSWLSSLKTDYLNPSTYMHHSYYKVEGKCDCLSQHDCIANLKHLVLVSWLHCHYYSLDDWFEFVIFLNA